MAIEVHSGYIEEVKIENNQLRTTDNYQVWTGSFDQSAINSFVTNIVYNIFQR